MTIYEGVEGFPRLNYPVVTSGTFDGVHLGHVKILRRISEIAKANQGQTVLITYSPHPREVLFPNEPKIHLLSSFEEKSKLLEKNGIDHLIKIPFTTEFSQLSSEEFVRNYLVDRLNTKKLVIGYNHRFGKNREGSFEYLSENASIYGFEVEEIPKQDLDHVAISSSTIRKALGSGKISEANKFLGRYYTMTGKVVTGNQLGRTIGFPTANLQIFPENKLIPADGTYAVLVDLLQKKYKAMMNIGYRPTVNGFNKTIEVHIFDFNQSIYDEIVTIHFIKQIRNEVKFENIERLTAQLSRDRDMALSILKSY